MRSDCATQSQFLFEEGEPFGPPSSTRRNPGLDQPHEFKDTSKILQRCMERHCARHPKVTLVCSEAFY